MNFSEQVACRENTPQRELGHLKIALTQAMRSEAMAAMKKNAWKLSLVLSLVVQIGLSSPAKAFDLQDRSQIAQVPDDLSTNLEAYQRKYISVYPLRPLGQLDHILMDKISSSLKRFDYNTINREIAFENLPDFFTQAIEHQRDSAGEKAANKSNESLKYGDAVITWSETQAIANSLMVFTSSWEFEPVSLKSVALKKHYRDSKGNYPKAEYPSGTYTLEETNALKQTYLKYWVGNIGSTLKLTLDIYRMEQGELKKYQTVSDSWRMAEPYYLTSGDIAALRNKFNIQKPENFSLSQIEYLYSLPQFSQYRRIDPVAKYLSQAEQTLKRRHWDDFIKRLRALEAFNIKTQLDTTASGDVKIVLPEGERAENLDLKLDHGFRVFESIKTAEEQTRTRQIGYIKVRAFSPDLKAQTIMAEREFEPGDQLREDPKAGRTIRYALGAYPARFGDETSFIPSLGIGLDWNTAPALGISELYAGIKADIGYNPLDRILVFDGGLTLFKRFYMRQFIFAFGANLDIQTAGKADTSAQTETDMIRGFGVTPTVGIHYFVSPEQIIGLDLGYRFFTSEITNGPSIQAFSSTVF